MIKKVSFQAVNTKMDHYLAHITLRHHNLHEKEVQPPWLKNHLAQKSHSNLGCDAPAAVQNIIRHQR